MAKIFALLHPIYVLLLGIGVGALIATGALSAPVVFSMSSLLDGMHITREQSGIVMGQIFVRLNYMLVALLIIMAIYEILSLIANSAYGKICFVLLLINAVCIVLFVFYYTPFILDPQNLVKDNFDSMHEGSVIVFKILTFGLGFSFLFHVYYAIKNRS